jgi:hypothetical protein
MLRRVAFVLTTAVSLLACVAAAFAADAAGPAVVPYGAVLAAYTPYNQMPVNNAITYPGSPTNERGFRLVNAELGAVGMPYWDWLTIVVSGEAEQNSNGTYGLAMENAYVKIAYLPDALKGGPFQATHGITVGAMKIPFSEQSLQSLNMLQFIRMAVATEQMPIQYDIGATLDADYRVLQDMLNVNLRFGGFDGAGNMVYGPDNNASLQYVGRARVDLLHKPPPGEGATDTDLWDTCRGKVELPHIGLGYSQLQNNDLARVVKAWDLEADIAWAGISISGEYIFTDYRPNLASTRATDALSDHYTSAGWWVQGGVFVVPKIVELAARYEVYAMDLLAEVEPVRRIAETNLGLNVHIVGNHKAKFMADYTIRQQLSGMPQLKNNSVNLAVGMMF